jgi:hypothetical protein
MKRRSTTLHKQLIKDGASLHPETVADVLGRLPVVAKDQAKKTTLIRELNDVSLAEQALWNRRLRVAQAIERLRVERRLIEIRH